MSILKIYNETIEYDYAIKEGDDTLILFLQGRTVCTFKGINNWAEFKSVTYAERISMDELRTKVTDLEKDVDTLKISSNDTTK